MAGKHEHLSLMYDMLPGVVRIGHSGHTSRSCSSRNLVSMVHGWLCLKAGVRAGAFYRAARGPPLSFFLLPAFIAGLRLRFFGASFFRTGFAGGPAGASPTVAAILPSVVPMVLAVEVRTSSPPGASFFESSICLILPFSQRMFFSPPPSSPPTASSPTSRKPPLIVNSDCCSSVRLAIRAGPPSLPPRAPCLRKNSFTSAGISTVGFFVAIN